MDHTDRETRSRIMSKVRSSGNRSTEVRLRAYLVRRGLRGWRLHPKGLLGKPDFVFPAERVAVFVDGCFWHGCPVCGRPPHSRQEYWGPKIARNRERDSQVTESLQREGWTVVRAWEHEVKGEPDAVVARIREAVERTDGSAGP